MAALGKRDWAYKVEAVSPLRSSIASHLVLLLPHSIGYKDPKGGE